MRHQDLTLTHRLETWIYANAGARISATGFVAADVGRIAYQTDTGQYWRLQAVVSGAPVWKIVGAAPVTLQTGSLLATGTTAGATLEMCGLGALGGLITPAAASKIYASIRGSCNNNTTGGGIAFHMRYGSGPAPGTGAAQAGNVASGVHYAGGLACPANTTFPFNITAIITGLTIGTPYWLDLAFSHWIQGTANISLVQVAAFELS